MIWKDLVTDIVIDETMNTAPKVISEAQMDQGEQGGGAMKRKAQAQNGPVGKTPKSAERKPKERRQRTPDNASMYTTETETGTHDYPDLNRVIDADQTNDTRASDDAFTQAENTLAPQQQPQTAPGPSRQPTNIKHLGDTPDKGI